MPFAAAHNLPDKAQEQRSFDAVAAFGAPWSMRMLEIDAIGMYDTAAEAQGKTFMTTEFGGGGTTSARIYPVDRTGAAPVEFHARWDGLLAACHFPGLVKAGDCIAVIAAVDV